MPRGALLLHERDQKMAGKKMSGNLTATISTLTGWIEKNLSARITTRGIAAAAGYSSRHLHSGFVQLTGAGPARYILLRKLTQAAYLLHLTTLSVTDIAHRFAFSSLQSFSRAFRRHFSLSPLAYRRAGKWDIRHTVPLPVNRRFQHTCHLVYRTGMWLKTFRKQKITLPADNKPVISERGDVREDIYRLFYNHLFRHIPNNRFTLFATVRLNAGPALCVDIAAGSLCHTKKQNAVFIPPAYWLSYIFTGSLKETILFTQWVNQHRLKTTGVKVRIDQTLTSYIRHPGHLDTFSICYSLPCRGITARHDESAAHYWPYSAPYDLYFYDRGNPGSTAYPVPDRPGHSRRHDEAYADETQRGGRPVHHTVSPA
ncbi:helix-turn-helix transcriptional regulator [Salmonella enterica subsp. enterica]|nr:helix-turn-helix transcriptional regulator [Salmonella enterica subsp. enterica]ECJ7251592.1 helix-turn-helix transcriptional regulator [Salmonella enterica subsp. enterica]